MSTLDVRVRVHDAGTSTPTDMTVDFTLDVSDLSQFFEFGGQRIRPLESKTEGIDYELLVTDANETMTSRLSDSGGRMVLLNRLVEIQTSVDGGAWTTRDIGRLADVGLVKVPTYRIQVTDEGVIPRRTNLFETVATDTTVPRAAPFLVPRSIDEISIAPIQQYGDFIVQHAQPRISPDPVATGNLVPIKLDQNFLNGPPLVSDGNLVAGGGRQVDHADSLPSSILELIKDDIKRTSAVEQNLESGSSASSGNFEKLRCRVNGTDYEVFGFGSAAGGVPTTVFELTDDLDMLQAGAIANLELWIVAPSWGPGNIVINAVLYMPTEQPSSEQPVFIGSSGTHAITLLRNLLEQETNARIDTSNFSTFESDTFYPEVTYIATQQENAEEWIRKNILRQFLLVLAKNGDGEIKLIDLKLPQDIDPSTLFEFDSSNSTFPHPQWRHGIREQVTKIRASYFVETDVAADADDVEIIKQVEKTLPDFDHDRLANFEESLATIEFSGIHARGIVVPTSISGSVIRTGAIKYADAVQREWFDRFGDGAIWGTIDLLADTASPPDVGDWVRINISTFPNPNSQARGGTRVVQIMSKRFLVRSGDPGSFKIRYDWLDGGPNLSALSTPTVSVAQNSSTPKHDIDVTLSNTNANSWQLQTRELGGTWQIIERGSGNTTVTIGDLASGTTWEFRARTVANQRIRSAWSSSDSVATASLTAITGMTIATASDGDTLSCSWTTGETDYPIELLLDNQACAGSSREPFIQLPAGTSEFDVTGLTASTTYCIEARHFDEYGGVGAGDTAEETTTATPRTAPDVRGLKIVSPSLLVADGEPPPRFTHGIGLAVEVGDADFSVEIQRSPDGSTGWETIVVLSPGDFAHIDQRAADGNDWFYRARHVDVGYTDGAWSATVSDTAQPILQSGGMLGREAFDGGMRAQQAINTSYNLTNETKVADTSGDFPLVRHTEFNTAQDGDTINYDKSFEGTPKIVFIPQVGASYLTAFGSSADQFLDMRAESPDASGFTLRAKLVKPQTVTAITDGFSASQNTAAPENGDVSLTSDGDVAYSNLEDANATLTTYQAFFDVDTTSMIAPSTVTVELWYNDGVSSTNWTLGDSSDYSHGVNLTDESLSVDVALNADFDLRLRVSVSGSGSFTVTAHGEDNGQPGVEYDKVTARPENAMTPNAGDKIAYLARESL